MLLPQRTPQDKNGDIGEAAVRLIWNKAGSAAEKIGKDYGDDLLIQTGPDGRVDASRIWVQVKAREDTRGLRKLNGTKTLPVDIKNVLKWIRRTPAA